MLPCTLLSFSFRCGAPVTLHPGLCQGPFRPQTGPHSRAPLPSGLRSGSRSWAKSVAILRARNADTFREMPSDPRGPGMPPLVRFLPPHPHLGQVQGLPAHSLRLRPGCPAWWGRGPVGVLDVFVDPCKRSSVSAGLPQLGVLAGSARLPAVCQCHVRVHCPTRVRVLTRAAPPCPHPFSHFSSHSWTADCLPVPTSTSPLQFTCREQNSGVPAPGGVGMSQADVSATQCGCHGDGTQTLRVSLCRGAGRGAASSEGDA